MDDMLAAPPAPSGRNGASARPPQRREGPPQEQYDGVIGAPPPTMRDPRSGRPQRPVRPQENDGRISQRNRSANGQSPNGHGQNGYTPNGNGRSPNGKQSGRMVPQTPPAIRFDENPNENYSDAGYGGSYQNAGKTKKKKRGRRRKKHKRDSVMLNDQKQDVNEKLELWDDNGHKLMHFSADVVDNLRT